MKRKKKQKTTTIIYTSKCTHAIAQHDWTYFNDFLHIKYKNNLLMPDTGIYVGNGTTYIFSKKAI